MDLKEMMDIEQCAEKMQMSTSWIYKNVKPLRIPHIRFGRKIFFDPADIENWLEKRKVKK